MISAQSKNRTSSKMLKRLNRYVQIGGFTHNEKVVLDEIEKEISHLKYKRDNKYGISVYKGTGDEITLLDTHVDKVQKKHMIPKQIDKEIYATALDNRIGVSVNLELCKTLKPKDNQTFIFLFTVREEVDGTGMLKFIEKTSKKERKKWKNFYEIDVCYAKDSKGYFKEKTFIFGDDKEYFLSEFLDVPKMPIIGKGICPIDQKFASYEYQKTGIKHNTNSRQMLKKLPDIMFTYLAVPVIDMHYLESRCHIDDIMRLYEYLLEEFNK